MKIQEKLSEKRKSGSQEAVRWHKKNMFLTTKENNCMFLSCHVRVSEWIHMLYLPECQGTPCSKQARYLKFKWLILGGVSREK